MDSSSGQTDDSMNNPFNGGTDVGADFDQDWLSVLGL
jgi:hypothetical protein